MSERLGYQLLNRGQHPFPLPDFRPRLPWLGAHLQTLSGKLRPLGLGGGDGPSRIYRFKTPDASGDMLIGIMTEPPRSAKTGDEPLIILVHGLTGCSESRYMIESAAHFVSLGYPVLRLNLRGAGPSRGYCHGQYHSGKTADFEAVMTQLPENVRERDVFVVGFSLGGNLLLKYLGERAADPRIKGAAAVSPPIDLQASAACIASLKNRGYERFLLSGMRREALLAKGTVEAVGAQTILKARDIREFDTLVTAPVHGFDGPEHYYAYSSAKNYLDGIEVPTLMVHAGNDPWIPSNIFHDYNWSQAPAVSMVLSDSGGHMGFVSQTTDTVWYLECIGRFIAALRGEELNATAA